MTSPAATPATHIRNPSGAAYLGDMPSPEFNPDFASDMAAVFESLSQQTPRPVPPPRPAAASVPSMSAAVQGSTAAPELAMGSAIFGVAAAAAAAPSSGKAVGGEEAEEADVLPVVQVICLHFHEHLDDFTLPLLPNDLLSHSR